MWHVSSRSGVATLRTAIHLLLTYSLTHAWATEGLEAFSWQTKDNVAADSRITDIQPQRLKKPVFSKTQADGFYWVYLVSAGLFYVNGDC